MIVQKKSKQRLSENEALQLYQFSTGTKQLHPTQLKTATIGTCWGNKDELCFVFPCSQIHIEILSPIILFG